MDAGAALDVTPDNFQTEVIERSQSVPVFVLFWADQVPPSVQTKALLEQLMARYQGKALLALSDVSVDQTLAQHLRVQGLPSIRVVFQGKIAEQIDGPADEAQLSALLDALTQSPADMLKDQLDQVIASGDWDTALAMLQEAVNQEPNNQGFRVELADILIRKGELDDARTVLGTIPEDTPERDRPQCRLEFVEEAAGLPSLDELTAAVEANPDDLESKYQLCVRLATGGELTAALDTAMEILRTDREFREDIGRLTMLRIFSVMGKGDETVAKYRRKMFNFMH
jgi:putative thioredoxin